MSWTDELLAELNVLSLFPVESIQEGIKVHSSADPAKVAAVERLFNKGLVDQKDGGYLTSLGLEAVRNLSSLKSILASA